MLNKQFGRRVLTPKAPPHNIFHWEGRSVRGGGKGTLVGVGGPSRGGVNKSFTLFNITDVTEYCRFISFSCTYTL